VSYTRVTAIVWASLECSAADLAVDAADLMDDVDHWLLLSSEHAREMQSSRPPPVPPIPMRDAQGHVRRGRLPMS
jgi:hypothetical protein